MKIKHFFLMALAIFALSACNNDELVPSGNEPQEQGYLILSLSSPNSPNPNPPAYTSGTATDNGTATENQINSVIVVLANATGTISTVINPSITNGVTEKFKVLLGDHYVYALVNSPITIREGDNINQVISLAEAIGGFTDGSLFMSNPRNSSAEQAGVFVTITNTNSLTNPAKINIHVDRVACKINDETTTPTVTALAATTDNLVDDVDVEGFAILNVNKEFNLIQTWDTYNANDLILLSEVLSTPVASTGLVAEQYLYNISQYTSLTKNAGDTITAITDLTLGKPELFRNVPLYVSENRPIITDYGNSGITAGRGETTGVIYKVQAKNGGSDLGTFYKCKNILSEDLDDVQALPEFTGKTLSTLSNPELRALGIKVYENGVMYYSHFIRDPNEAHQHADLNYYAVFRNSSYKLKINSISALGDDVPGGAVVDPSKPGEPGNPPIDTEDAYLEVSVTVNPWILNLIDIDF